MANKYVDADGLYEKIHNIGGCDADPDTWADGWDKAIDECLDILADMPAADVQEVRRGRWKGYTRSAFYGLDEMQNQICRDVNVYVCSECGRKTVVKENYCPNCGAKMDGE